MIRCKLSSLDISPSLFTNISDRDESENEDTDTAADHEESEGPLSKMVLIEIGRARNVHTIPVHRDILCEVSVYFELAFEEDADRSSFDFPEQEPEIFTRTMNWIYARGFLLPKDNPKKQETAAPTTQASAEVQRIDESADSILVEHGSGYRQSVAPQPLTRVIDGDYVIDSSDDEQKTKAVKYPSTKTPAPTPLDALMLSKIYALAEFLQIKDLCNEIINLLGQRLGYDRKTPGQALIYAFQRCGADSPLRKLLIDFTARAAPISDVLEESTFDATPELLRAMVKELTVVRGADVLRGVEWTEHFEDTLGDYRV